ncbi:hypothetical protein [Marinobacter sp. CHS3-4]|uniref:hypothetical protein n=1 Tax=Marinobacter sp. CHS3-4 TaxID=3045174 RepID=UPI0024B5363A|nr:hypothetical protein [Marinobacter sp. CHS3-4]MDI9245682.1 hypothetical protein [Marinobacter sp. CHS3-4]
MKNRAMQILCAATATATMLLAPAGITVAEELKMSVKSQTQRSLQQDLPRNGLSESSVRNAWGDPQSITGPVGEPPITQWHYENFVVYFEGNRVIHSVLKHNR